MKRAVFGFTYKLMAVLLTVTFCHLQSACGTAIGEQSERVINGTENDTLVMSTYLGGSDEDTIRDITTDAAGNLYVTGGTASANFPTTAGAFDTSFNGTMDVFVAKFDPAGALLWATFLGGPNYDRAYAIEVDHLGNVYVAGRAGAGFPTTAGALQRSFAGDVVPNPLYGPQDGFIAKLSADGAHLLWATYFGSDGRDFIRDLAVDGAGNVYVGVSDVTRAFPYITAGAFQRSLRGPSDGVVAKVASDGRSVVWASYFGGSADDGGTPSVRVDAAGSVYYLTHTNSTDAPVTPNAYKRTYSGGTDLMLAKFAPNGSSLIYSTYFGGNRVEFTETHGLAVNAAGNAYIAFTTQSTNLPTTATAFQHQYGGSGGSGTGSGTNYSGDVFVAKLSSDGAQLLAATYVGGRFGEGAEGIALDAAGNVYISGATYSDNFPVTAGALQVGLAGQADLFAVKLTGDLSQIVYSTCLGGSGTDLGRTAAVDHSGSFYVAGMTNSVNWPAVGAIQHNYAGAIDGVLVKLTLVTCQDAISPTSQGFQASGGTGRVQVSAPGGCRWTAVSNVGWVSVTAGGTGTGSGPVDYLVVANPNTSPRTGTITIAGLTFTVTQAAAQSLCNYAITPTSASFPASGGKSTVTVTTGSGCSWTAVSHVGWLSVFLSGTGSGTGKLTYLVAANTSSNPRTGTITIAGLTFTVTQAGTDLLQLRR